MFLRSYAEIAQRIEPGATLLRSHPLVGGVRASVTALYLATPRGPRTLVVRQLPASEDASELAATEFELLRALQGHLPVPVVHHVDTTGGLLPSPFLVMDFVEGTTEVTPENLDAALSAMVALLVRVHALDPATLDLPSLQQRHDPVPVIRACWHPLLEPARTVIEDYQTEGSQRRVVHGDFWSGNLLWRDGAITALLDWEDAALGDPLSDLAGVRQELRWKHGPAATEAFTAAYLARTGRDARDLAIWDLHVGTSAYTYMGQWGLPVAQVAHMRRESEAFIADAVARIRSI